MSDEEFDRPGSSSDMTGEELEIAQWRIDVCEPGYKKIDEIYGEYWVPGRANQQFGKTFKAAVRENLLKGISIHAIDGKEVLASDRQLLYIVLTKL